MWRRFSLLVLWCAVSGLDALEADRSADPTLEKMPSKPGKDSPSAAKPQQQFPERVSSVQQRPSAEPLEDEMDNQENIISQARTLHSVALITLLGDYDKVKTVSSGSDCVCRCIVRPIKRSDCSRIHDSDQVSQSQDFYTVETQKNYDKPFTGNQIKRSQVQDSMEQQQPTRNKTGTQKVIKDKTEPKQPIKDKSSMVIRGVTFYKAEEGGYEEEERGRGKNTSVSVDLLISDQLSPTRITSTRSPRPSVTVPTKHDIKDLPRTLSMSTPTRQPTPPPTTVQQNTPTTKPAPTTVKTMIQSTTSIQPTTTTSQQTTTTTTTTQPPRPVTQKKVSPSDTNIRPPVDVPPTATSQQRSKTRLSWTESPADQPKTTKKPAVCKDTVASISEPVQQNTYGLSDGVWMRDARGHGNVIYLTNGHYGNNLQEFRDMNSFKSGQASNSYKLPYSFTGTGHVVFNGAFYYNRAFSRDIIRYDLRHRYVAAWTTLHDAILEEQVHRTQTEVEFAVDESGLWLLYPALDTEGFHQEVILLTQLHHRDLQPIRSFRTGLRRGRYGNSFLVCGVLYAVDSMERRYANVTYAFDTHTLTHTVPSLAFTNMHTHTSQLSYCPLDKKLYAWDDGHQMMYDVIFAY
ncbi:hypothetical protein PAMP_004357 [Pampus punctatissimus]